MIKAIITLTLASFGFASYANGPYPITEPPTAEIQIMVDYRGFDQYAYKLVSTPTRLITAGYLYPNDRPEQNGACFKGDVYDAAELFRQMIQLMNEQWSRFTPTEVHVAYEDVTLKPYLKVDYVDVYGRSLVWFPKLRECTRWSTPDERLLEPAN